ncbi:hypothetical protein EW146_g9218 [Bondarzewia mesenterica]|uniref:Peroxisomal membrane protein PEX14 n=1 Tax=Bondarzewia mesenterica TaxID=1095465 RepID=A0A4S4L817_9AGAM|nr:hypothetical protein EW146_g9218 [Bondarzewia mesenterica]
MKDNDNDGGSTSVSSPPEAAPSTSQEQPPPQSQPYSVSERTELLERARVFLTSPQVRHEDLFAKRRFLREKGLSEVEIDGLLQELPLQTPLVPPRTYPRPPPSNLPNLLAGLFRIFTWVAGGSSALLLLYYRFLLPRLTKSSLARRSIVNHQRDLLSKLTSSLSEMKETQKASFEILPHPEPYKEEARYAQCSTLDDVVAASEGKQDIPEIALLRCALADFAKQGQQPSLEELFREVSTKLPWFESDPSYQERVWATLSNHPFFLNTEESASKPGRWLYLPPTPLAPNPLESSLHLLKSALPLTNADSSPHRFQHTLQSLIDFTGYLTTQTYSLSSALPRSSGLGGPALSPEEDEGYSDLIIVLPELQENLHAAPAF